MSAMPDQWDREQEGEDFDLGAGAEMQPFMAVTANFLFRIWESSDVNQKSYLRAMLNCLTEIRNTN